MSSIPGREDVPVIIRPPVEDVRGHQGAQARVAAALLAAAALCALSGCAQIVVQPYKHKTVYESIYGREPP